MGYESWPALLMADLADTHWGNALLVAWRRVSVTCVVHESCVRRLKGKPTGERLPLRRSHDGRRTGN
jgi:hypothetical protein